MWGRVIAVVLLAVVIQHVARLTFRLHSFQKVINHAPGPCRHLRNVVHGAEDGYLLPNGLLFISSGFGRAPGKLLKLNLDSTNDYAEEFLIEGDLDKSGFSPHGIGAWEDRKTGQVTLFVVNHHKDGERVEVFRHDGSKTSKTLQHVKTIREPKLPVLNDVVATGPDSFYGSFFYKFSLELDFFLMYPGGGVVHYDGGELSVPVSGLTLGNGINISPDRQYLYVAEGFSNIRTYKIQSDKTLREEQVYYTGTGNDNIHVDRETGDLWVGTHPNMYIMSLHLMFRDKNYSAYSQVIRLKADKGRIVDIREVYANDGTDISASAVAIPYKKKLFIGTVIDRAIVCDLVYPG